jgi:hypothetical protein
MLFREIPELQAAVLAPESPIAVDPKWPPEQRALTGCFNRLGGLMRALAQRTATEVPSVLAVWYVESGGKAHRPNQAIIRFECNLFFKTWGQANIETYRQHFRHGGFEGQPGKGWQRHEFREDPAGEFEPVHKSQASEYRALALACRLSGDEPGLGCASIGGCQIVLSNAKMIGYGGCREMHDAFQTTESAHVLGFFDFCQTKPAPKKGDLLGYLREKNWQKFAHYYNGPGQAEMYGGRIRDNFERAQTWGLK